MALRFDTKLFENDLLAKLQKNLGYAFDIWESDVYKHLKHPFYGEDIRPYVSHYFRVEGKTLMGFLQANTYVLADSYGTGSLMLDNNPGLAAYKADKDRWNPERTGKAIVGRRQGSYVDIFGRKHTTSGVFAGKNIEGRKVNSSNKTKKRRKITGYYIAPTHPSYAIQIAEKWLYENYIPKMYAQTIKEMNFAKYLKES